MGEFVLVDGKQRLTAVRKFLANDLKAFGHYFKEYTDSLRTVRNTFKFHVNDLGTRAQVLNWYLEMNSGGTVHTQEEIEKVKNMLKETKCSPNSL